MPDVPEPELEMAVHLRAVDVIPFPMDKTLLSAIPLDTYPGPTGTPTRRIFIAAAHRDLVDPLVRTVKAAGLTPLSIDLTSSALVRSLQDPSSFSGQPEAIVSIGAASTTVVVHQDGKPQFVRTIAEGGDAVTASIASALDIPLTDAEEIKRNLDRAGPQVRAAAAVATEASLGLITDIRNSLGYFTRLRGRRPVSRIVVTGGGSRLDGLLERMADQIRLPVAPGSCLEGIDATELGLEPQSLEEIDTRAAVVVGLALPPGADEGRRFNLLPPEVAAERVARKVERGVLVAAGVIVLAMIGFGVLRLLQVQNAENKVGADRAAVSSLTEQTGKLNYVGKATALAQSKSAMVKPLLAPEVVWPNVISAMALLTPKRVTTTSWTGTTVTPTSAEAGSASAGPSATTTTTLAPGALPRSTTIIGTCSVKLAAPSYQYYGIWLQDIQRGGAFIVQNPSGVNAAPNGSITWSATLAITGVLHTHRLSHFEVVPS
jgi:type IV pilus assembly protein PilM